MQQICDANIDIVGYSVCVSGAEVVSCWKNSCKDRAGLFQIKTKQSLFLITKTPPIYPKGLKDPTFYLRTEFWIFEIGTVWKLYKRKLIINCIEKIDHTLMKFFTIFPFFLFPLSNSFIIALTRNHKVQLYKQFPITQSNANGNAANNYIYRKLFLATYPKRSLPTLSLFKVRS